MLSLHFTALRVDWTVFDVLNNDDKLVDLTIAFGDPFPKEGSFLALKSSYDADAETKRSELGFVENTDIYIPKVGEDADKAVAVYLNTHEGQRTSISPFSIHPKQTVYSYTNLW